MEGDKSREGEMQEKIYRRKHLTYNRRGCERRRLHIRMPCGKEEVEKCKAAPEHYVCKVYVLPVSFS